MRTSGDTAGWPRARRCTSGGHRRHCQNDGGGHRGQGQEGKLAARPAPAGIMMMLLEVSLERSGVSAAPGGRHVDADVPTTTIPTHSAASPQRGNSARAAPGGRVANGAGPNTVQGRSPHSMGRAKIRRERRTPTDREQRIAPSSPSEAYGAQTASYGRTCAKSRSRPRGRGRPRRLRTKRRSLWPSRRTTTGNRAERSRFRGREAVSTAHCCRAHAPSWTEKRDCNHQIAVEPAPSRGNRARRATPRPPHRKAAPHVFSAPSCGHRARPTSQRRNRPRTNEPGGLRSCERPSGRGTRGAISCQSTHRNL